jgi:hypothetical protein
MGIAYFLKILDDVQDKDPYKENVINVLFVMNTMEFLKVDAKQKN